jgi:transcriptional regulator with XRE-family HTH domain
MYERIRSLREDADLKQKELAEMLAVGQTTYSDYELGKLNIPVPLLIRLAGYYGTSIDYLVGLTDVKTPYPRGKRRGS